VSLAHSEETEKRRDTGEGNASEIMMLAGRVHDLIIVQQRHEGFDEPGWDVAESGTPTLVVPFAGSFPSVGAGRVLVAWKWEPASRGCGPRSPAAHSAVQNM